LQRCSYNESVRKATDIVAGGANIKDKKGFQTASSLYLNKDHEYFEHVRHDALSLVPADVDRVLEIGCGKGNTLAWLKANRACAWVGGVELSDKAAREARENLDAIYEGDIETLYLPVEPGSLDAILCLDVLEHLVDPWHVVQRMHKLLKPGGVLIASVPNVRNFRVLVPLLLFGKWEYQREGLLDETHLRFFTRDSAIELLQCSGLRVDMTTVRGLEGSKSRIANAITLSRFQRFLEYQYLMRARRSD
jgi:SAM-dependent methyltransferase